MLNHTISSKSQMVNPTFWKKDNPDRRNGYIQLNQFWFADKSLCSFDHSHVYYYISDI